MAIGSDFNIRELKSIYGQLDGYTGGELQKLLSYGDIAWFSEALGIGGSIEQIASGDAQQQANGIQSLVNQAMSLVEKIVNSQSAANKRVSDDAKKVDGVVEDAQSTEADLNLAITETEGQIKTQTGIVDQANRDIAATQDALVEKQRQIDEIIAEIQKKQQELAAAKTTEEQKGLLEEIQALGTSISALTVDITTHQDTIEQATSNMLQASAEIEAAKDNSLTVLENGVAEITQATQDATQASGDIVATQADGVKNISLGTALETSAAAESIIPIIGGALAGTTAQKGAELISAGTIETTGAVNNLQKLLQGIGGIANNTQLLGTFKNAIGGALDSFNSALGTWNETIEPVITSIGSFTSDNGYITLATDLEATVIGDIVTVEEAEMNAGLDAEVNASLTNLLGNNSSDKSETTGNTDVTAGEENTGAVVKAVEDLETPKFTFGI